MKLIRVVFVLILIMEDIAIKKIKSVRCGYEFFTYNQKQNWLNIIIFYIRNVILISRYKPREDIPNRSVRAVSQGLKVMKSVLSYLED